MDRKTTETAYMGADTPSPWGALPEGAFASAPAAEGLGRPRLGFIGAGVVGRTLAQALARAGYPVVAAASRRLASAQALADTVEGCRAYPTPQDAVDAADLVFITTPDEAIAGVAATLAWRPRQMVVHTSGACSTDVLEPARAAGALVGVFHPLQSFAGPEAVDTLPGTTFALEGDEALLPVLKAMAEALGGRWLVLGPGDKALYHAAAVLVSNYTVALMGAACRLWERLGVEEPGPSGEGALLPLLRGTVANIARLGPAQGLTGPIARGDAATVAQHLAALAARAPELLPAYRELGLLAIPLGLAKGTLTREGAAELRRLLRGDARKPIAQPAGAIPCG